MPSETPTAQPTVTCYLNKSTGYWHANVYWGRSDRVRPSLRVRTEAEALVAFEVFKRDELPILVTEHTLRRNALVAEARQTKTDPRIADLVTWYCERHLVDLGRSEGTLSKYTSILDNFAVFCRARHIGRVSQLSYDTVTEFLDWLEAHGAQKLRRKEGKHSRAYRDNCKTILRGWLYAAVEANRLAEAPITKWFINKAETEEPDTFAMTAGELRQCLLIIDAEAPHIANLVRFMAHTGTRPSDALDLRWSQVHEEARYARRKQVKTKNLATYSLNAEAMASIANEKARRAPKASHVFTNPAHKPYTYNVLYRGFTRALARVNFAVERDGVPRFVNMKCLRHTYGTLMAHLGCPPFLLQRQMGHTKIETTLRYYHTDPNEGLLWADKFNEITTENAPHGVTTPVTP